MESAGLFAETDHTRDSGSGSGWGDARCRPLREERHRRAGGPRPAGPALRPHLGPLPPPSAPTAPGNPRSAELPDRREAPFAGNLPTAGGGGADPPADPPCRGPAERRGQKQGLPPAPTFRLAPPPRPRSPSPPPGGEAGAAPRPPPGSCREGRKGGREGGRCPLSLSLFPTRRPLPSSPRARRRRCPVPRRRAARSPPAAGRAGHGTAQQGRAGQGRAAARLRAPLPSPGMAGRWGTPHRPGSARLCPAEGLGAQPPALLANGPERHVQIASQPGAGGADGAAGQPPVRGGGSAGTAGGGGARPAARGLRRAAGPGRARLGSAPGGASQPGSGRQAGSGGAAGAPRPSTSAPRRQKSLAALLRRLKPPSSPPPPPNAAPLTRTMDGTPRATEAPSVKRTVELPGGRMWKQPLPFRSSSARVSLAGGACVPCSANLLFLYLTRTARCRNHPPPPHRLRSRLCWWAKAAGAGCGAGILGRPKVLSALQASGARLRCGRWLHGHLWNFNNSVRAGCGQGSGVRRGGVFAGLVKTLCFGRWFLVNVWVLHNIFEFAGVGYEDLRCYF